MQLFPRHTHWDIFCNVVDNYGDIGVCWRLARQLAREQQQRVRLWVDDLASFQKICPNINPALPTQQIQHIEICLWSSIWQSVEVADIVIEAFACHIPEPYIKAMTQTTKAILWLNLEYLTYEDWSIDYHTLPSLQANGLNKYFFFTGLAETGGLIREKTLFNEQTHFLADPQAEIDFLQQLGVTKQANAYLMLIFSYENKQLAPWLHSLAHANKPYHLLIPHSPLLVNLANYLNLPPSQLTVGYTHKQGSLTVQIIPFVNQPAFDQLLWCTDFNLVRGEDSFVRAQYAGKPMLWHIYPQQDNIHITKLKAFLNHYLIGLSTEAQKATIELWLAWNNQQDIASYWQTYQKHLSELNKHAKIWKSRQQTSNNLLKNLANFYKNWLS